MFMTRLKETVGEVMLVFGWFRLVGCQGMNSLRLQMVKSSNEVTERSHVTLTLRLKLGH